MTAEEKERFEKLESSVAHLERLYEELNKVVVEQDRLFTKTRQQLLRVSRTIEILEGERIRSTNAKPPHYQ